MRRMRYLFLLGLLIVSACSPPSNGGLDASGPSDAGPTTDAELDTAETDAGWNPDAGPPPDASPASPDASSPAPSVTELSIATWNIEQFPHRGTTIEAVRDVVIAEDLDLIGVQEITDPEAFVRLADMLPDHEMYYSYDSWAFTRVGILYRADRVQVGEVARLFQRQTWAFPRDPLMAEITVLDDAGEAVFDFTFVVVHLKAQVDEESRQRRALAIEALEAWVRERVLVEPDVVVAGDFNDELTDPLDRNVYRPFLDAPERYRFLTLELERAGAYSYVPFRAMIDHVLVTSDALDEYGAGTTEVLELERSIPRYVDDVSDHRPVVSHFLIEAP